jgi:hypothetical protein
MKNLLKCLYVFWAIIGILHVSLNNIIFSSSCPVKVVYSAIIAGSFIIGTAILFSKD